MRSDLDTAAIVAAAIHPADQGDTTTLETTLKAAARGLDTAGCGPTIERPAELIADKGYHSRAVLKDLAGGPWQTRIAEPKPPDVQRWRGDRDARRAVYGDRARLRSGVGKAALALRAEKVERSFALVLDRGGLRRTHVRGRENVQKRYVIHVAGYNLGLVLRQPITAPARPRNSPPVATGCCGCSIQTWACWSFSFCRPNPPQTPLRQRAANVAGTCYACCRSRTAPR